MSYDWLYKAVMVLVGLPWALLVLKPQSDLTGKVLKGYWTIFSIAYTVLMASNINLLFRDLSEYSQVMDLASHPAFFMAIWIHILAFDLMTAQWIVTDAQKLSVPHKRIIPALFFTCMAGPVGLLIYFVIRKFPAPAPTSNMA